jgi:hypothetical protein
MEVLARRLAKLKDLHNFEITKYLLLAHRCTEEQPLGNDLEAEIDEDAAQEDHLWNEDEERVQV